MNEMFEEMCRSQSGQIRPISLRFLGRELRVAKSCGRIAQFSFNEMCVEVRISSPSQANNDCFLFQPRSAADYLQISKQFHTIFLNGVPRMTLSQKTAARRFITMIDTFYDNQVRDMNANVLFPFILVLLGSTCHVSRSRAQSSISRRPANVARKGQIRQPNAHGRPWTNKGKKK